MKRFFRFILCALMFLGMSLPMQVAAAGYVRVQMVLKHENGIVPESSAHVNNGNSDYCLNKEFWVNIIPAKLATSGYTSYNKENLIGIYRDEACTQLVATGDPGVWSSSSSWQLGAIPITQNDEDIVHYYATKAEADAAEPDVLYALFGYPKVTSQAGENITITDPYGSGTGYTWFRLANVSKNSFSKELWLYNYQGGRDQYGYTTNAITFGSWIFQNNGWAKRAATYTATNVHSGNVYICYAGGSVYDRNDGTGSTKLAGAVFAIFYVDLQPRFELEVDALDWSYNGETLVETFDVGNEVKASQRSRLQNKLVCKSANTNNNTVTAKNYATWTATIQGANADQFKFANGTQTVTGTYSADLLDVIYAPISAGTHTATLHIETSYTDAKGTPLTYTPAQDVALSGTAAVNSKITFTKAGNETPSTNEVHNFGDIIGTNAKEITADLFISQITNPTKTWSDPDGAFVFDESSVDLSQAFQTLTFRAKRSTPVTENTNHTATLTISGKNTSNEDVSATLTLSYTALPLLIPEVTWNWSSIKENTVATNPISTTSDGAWTLTKSAGDRVVYDAENETLTVPYLHHEPGVSADFALVIPQTDTYAAYHEVHSTEINVATPPNVYINSQEKFAQYATSWGAWSGSPEYISESNAVRIPKGASMGTLEFATNGQTAFEFDCSESITLSIYAYNVNKLLGYVLNNVSLPAGHHLFAIPHQTTRLDISKESSAVANLYNIHYWEYDTIQSDYDIIGLVEDGGIVTPLDVTTIMANKRQVTVSLNAEAQQYFELQSAGKATGATLTFTDADGLGIYEMIQPVITVALKEGVNVEQAKTASAGRSCLLTFADDYTYNHEVVEIPVVVINAYDVTYKHHPHGSYTVTYKNDPEHPQTVSGSDYVKHLAYIAPSHCTVTISSPTPENGYAFQGWKINGEWYSRNLSVTVLLDQAATVEPVFTEGIVGNFMVDGAYYDDLAEALNVANSGIAVDEPTVVVARDVLLNEPATYTIPEGVTLLVPHNENLRTLQLYPDLMLVNSATLENEAKLITAYRMLTLTDGVNIINNGTICVAGKMVTANGGRKSAYVTGACGVINMANGGHIELNNGSILYCWGLIKGQDMDQGNNTQDVGTITVNNGATIFEDFEVGDWRGGTATLNIYMNQERKLFPFQSYSIQNIEVPTTYTYGSLLRTYTNVYGGGGNNGAVFSMIGSNETMFLLKDEQSFVRKWYDPTTDLTCYELSGTAQLDALHIVVYISLSSEMFNLPVSNSMHIILKDCNMTLAKPLTVQPGAVVEVKAGATLNMAANIYMIDKDEWGKYIHDYYFRSFNTLTSHKNRGAEDSKEGLEDAKIIIDGTLNVVKKQGYIYSTAGGANLMGNGGGKVVFEGALPNPSELWHVLVASQEDNYVNWVSTPVTAANLRNEDGSYTGSNRGGANGYTTFYNVHGRWFDEETKNDNEVKEDHTCDFTYLDNGNSGEEVWVYAVYSHDKTGLEAREKWFNVEEVEGCPNWWIDANSYYYNYTLSDAWHQFIATETENLFSGSDNKLYEKDGCTFTPEIEIDDETCLYTIDEQTKALINSHFITLHPNPADAAYLNDAEDTYYICFKGCNWHEATPYPNEEKAYDIAEGGTYIWFEGEWMNVEREGDYFYTADPQTNVKTYYEYADGEWIVALPYVSVTDEIETRTFFSLPQAFTVASTKNNAVITILRDFSETTTHASNPIKFTKQNTNCTLDLNGHTANITVTGSGTSAILKMIEINAAGSTFTITDNSGYNNGVLNLTSSLTTPNANQRWHGVYVTNGSLVLNEGTIKVLHENNVSGTEYQARASAVCVDAGQSFTMNGGTLDVKSSYDPLGVHVLGSTTANATVTINSGKIKVESTKSSVPYGIYAKGGTVTINDVELTVTAKTTSARGIVAEVDKTNFYYGTIYVYGGTYTVKSTGGNTAVGVYVNGLVKSYNNGTASQPATIKSWARAKVNIYGGTFNVSTTKASSTDAYGVQSLGTTAIYGGTFNVTPKTTKGYGVYAQDGTVTIEGNPEFNIKVTAGYAYGIYANGVIPSTARTYNPVVTVNGGTYDIKATSSGSTYMYAINVDGNTNYNTSTDKRKGNYASAGKVIVNEGEFSITSTGHAYGAVIQAAKSISSASAYPTATANPKYEVHGGKFKMSCGSGKTSYPVNTTTTPANFTLDGGYFTDSINLGKHIVAPIKKIPLSQTTDPNYPEYKFKLAEAYLITFKNGDATLQSTYQNAGLVAAYEGDEPTKDNYRFTGWSPALTTVTANATYTAQFEALNNESRVELNSNGGNEGLQYVYVTTGEAIGTVPAGTTKDGHTFAGWFTAPSEGTKIEATTTVSANVTWYAHYTINQHTLTWDLAGGTIVTPGTSGQVNYGATITSPVVSRAGYTFAGWDATPVAKMPDNDLTYTAQWTPNSNTAYTVRHMKQNPANLEEYILDVEENFTGTTETYVSPKTKSYTGYVTPDRQTQQITGDGEMVVTYVYNLIPYTIVFDAETNGGTCDQEPIVVPYGKTVGSVLAVLPTATKEGNEFQGWFTKPVGGNAVSTEMVIQYNIGKVYAQFRAEADLVVDGEINISNNSTVETTTIHVTGRLTIDEGRTLTTTNLILEASDTESGEVIGNIVAENAYFDLKLNTPARHWRAFGVPWTVDINTNPLVEVETGRTLNISRDYEIMYYDGLTRALEGPGANCWKYLRHYDEPGQPVEELRPGQGYMIAFGSHVNTVRLVKKATAPILYTGSFEVAANNGATPADNGINAIANPMIYHATMDVGVGVAQVHDGGEIGSDGYTEVSIVDARFIVGKAVYVQVENEQSVVIDHASGSEPMVLAAPARRGAKAMNKKYLTLEDYYTVSLMNTEGVESKLYVLPEEEKNDEYVIGHDLMKMGMSTRKPQIWVKRYGVNLGLNTTVPINDVAEFPISVYAPNAGEYTISLVSEPDDEYTVFLTLNGEAIWNLSNSEYTTELTAGTNKSYGLRLSARKSPAVATGTDEALIDAQGDTKKVLINNQVFIIRGNNVYSVDGQLVK